MTYCFAWKSNNEVYMVADSVTSTKGSDFEVEADYSSMGEKYGEYNSYFVAETDIKIYIKENYIIAFSGDLKIFDEIKRNLDLMIGELGQNEIINYLKEILGDAEIILTIMRGDYNELFLLNKWKVQEVTDFASIGSGKNIKDLNNTIKKFTTTFPSFDDENIVDIPRKKLSAATAYFQIISLKNNFLDFGVGGAVCGLCIYDKKIEWNDDLLYFLYDEKFQNKKLVNLLVRNNTILTGSDFTGLTKLFRLPDVDENFDEVKMRKIFRTINKNISSHIPRYIIFYSKELNNIYFYDTHRKTHTRLVRMYRRRSNINVRWEIFTDPYLINEFLLKKNNDKDFAPPFHYLEGLPTPYLSRDKLIENTENIEDVDFEYDYFDYPLENIQINVGNIEGFFKYKLEDYENLIVVNFDYLESKILELRNFYKGLNVQFDSSNILKGLNDFLKREWEIDKFEILVFTNKYQFFYEKINELEMILVNENKEFALFANKLLYNYYTDPKYFHLNKIIIIDDSSYFNELFEILPDYNRNREETDIFMVKNQNSESKVLHSPFYYNADIIFSQLSGLSNEALGFWSPSEYTESELEEIRKYLNEQLK